MRHDTQTTEHFGTAFRIDLICDAFDRAWIAGEEPQLEQFLGGVPAKEQERLFPELLQIECEYRQQRGTLPVREEYELRFPESVDQVREVFRQYIDDVETSILDENSTQAIPTNGHSNSQSQRPIESQLDDFKILHELGRGGMGIVYKALQKSLNRIVAIKLISAGDGADGDRLRRFRMEAESVAKFDHPGIVPIYNFGQSSGQYFIAMPLIQGVDLHLRVKESPFEPKHAASIVRQSAEAIDYAHSFGIIHRDLKPHNILLVGNTPRITDFGLAKNIHDDSGLTGTGQIMGTPSYMSPEQAQGIEVGPATDIYSLGATLYCLLTGRPPFQASTTVETMRQVTDLDPAPPRTLNPGIPRDLETICLKCLRKNPASRYQSAGELADDLGRWLEGRPIIARRVSLLESAWLWCKRRPAVAGSIAAILLTLAATSAVISSQRAENSKRIVESQIENDRKRTASLVESLLTAPPVAIPYAINALIPLQDQSRPLLVEAMENPQLTDSQRLHATLALAYFGDERIESLIASIKTAESEECSNLITALRGGPTVIPLIQQQAQAARTAFNWRHRARLAIIAIHLGDLSIASEMVEPQADPIERTILIDTLASWHGNEVELIDVISRSTPMVQAGLLLGLSRVTKSQLKSGTSDSMLPLLTRLFLESPDAAVHSAADLTLRAWELPVPPIPHRPPRSHHNWYTTTAGQTMVQIPAGVFIRGDAGQTVTITRSYWMANKETTVNDFQRFADDQETPESERLQGWRPEVEQANTGLELPVHNVSWVDAILYCNWLSRQDGLTPCYNLDGSNWEWDQAANGYRLPTDAEWEHACRAATTTNFSWGNDSSFAPDHAIYMKSETEATGTRLPNLLGLFDMHGNASEWCYDRWSHEVDQSAALVDPVGPPTGTSRILRGGTARNGELSLQSSMRGLGSEKLRHYGIGFRIVAGPR